MSDIRETRVFFGMSSRVCTDKDTKALMAYTVAQIEGIDPDDVVVTEWRRVRDRPAMMKVEFLVSWYMRKRESSDATEKQEESCFDCKFYDNESCMRYPPVLGESVHHWDYPKVGGNQWCGEWKESA